MNDKTSSDMQVAEGSDSMQYDNDTFLKYFQIRVWYIEESFQLTTDAGFEIISILPRVTYTILAGPTAYRWLFEGKAIILHYDKTDYKLSVLLINYLADPPHSPDFLSCDYHLSETSEQSIRNLFSAL